MKEDRGREKRVAPGAAAICGVPGEQVRQSPAGVPLTDNPLPISQENDQSSQPDVKAPDLQPAGAEHARLRGLARDGA